MVTHFKPFAALTLVAGLSALGFAQTNVALNKPIVASSGYYDSGSETFPTSNITDGRFDDSGTGYNWSFWLTPQGQNTGFATVDLGGLYSISSFVLQDTHNRGFNDRGTNAYAIDVSTDGTNFSQVVSSAFTTTDWQNLTLKTNTLTAARTARYVRFDILSGYGGASAGLNELQVMATPVPEPSAIAALGLGAVALLRRRKRA